MRTGEKAGRTAAKRRTEVRRLCVRTILQGDEAQRNNPVIRPRNKNTLFGVFLFMCKDADENRRESRSNRRKKADGSTPVVRTHNFAR